MKLRWIDSKSKRMHEVLIDLNAILAAPSLKTQRASALCSALSSDSVDSGDAGMELSSDVTPMCSSLIDPNSRNESRPD